VVGLDDPVLDDAPLVAASADAVIAAGEPFAEQATPDAVSSSGAAESTAGEPPHAEIVIGFTEKTAETLVQIEAALGSENPEDSMKATEAEISQKLKWNSPVDEMSPDELDGLFSQMQDSIRRSAQKAGV
jgi:intracellular multiplication protein IcmO